MPEQCPLVTQILKLDTLTILKQTVLINTYRPVRPPKKDTLHHRILSLSQKSENALTPSKTKASTLSAKV